jgi:hypothetical protein
MCMGCALLAISGASAVRTWLDAHAAWLTPKRLKIASVVLVVLAIGVSTIGLKGSATTRTHHPRPAAAAAAPTAPAPAAVAAVRGGVRTSGRMGT